MKLAHRPGMPGSHYEPIGGTLATRRGWLIVLPDHAVLARHLDRIAIERLINGELDEATDEEKYTAARYLHVQSGLGLSMAVIADRVGAAERTVQRWSDDGWVERKYTADGEHIPDRTEDTRTLETAWADKTEATADGHLKWVGATKRGIPVLNHRKATCQAARIAYRIKHGADPEGSARPGCGISLCVHPNHIVDLPITQPLPPRRPRA